MAIDDQRFKRVMVTSEDQPFIEAAAKVLRGKLEPPPPPPVDAHDLNDEIVAVQDSGPRREIKLFRHDHPRDPLSTLPVKRILPKNPGNLTGRQLKKARKQGRRDAKLNQQST
jgi:hypothetical protein